MHRMPFVVCLIQEKMELPNKEKKNSKKWEARRQTPSKLLLSGEIKEVRKASRRLC